MWFLERRERWWEDEQDGDDDWEGQKKRKWGIDIRERDWNSELFKMWKWGENSKLNPLSSIEGRLEVGEELLQGFKESSSKSRRRPLISSLWRSNDFIADPVAIKTEVHSGSKSQSRKSKGEDRFVSNLHQVTTKPPWWKSAANVEPLVGNSRLDLDWSLASLERRFAFYQILNRTSNSCLWPFRLPSTFPTSPPSLLLAGQCRPLSKTVRFNVLKVSKSKKAEQAKQFGKF